jgi:hypothetical protein
MGVGCLYFERIRPQSKQMWCIYAVFLERGVNFRVIFQYRDFCMLQVTIPAWIWRSSIFSSLLLESSNRGGCFVPAQCGGSSTVSVSFAGEARGGNDF